MEHAEEFELATERWCAGLRFVETRPFDTVERALVHRHVAVLRKTFWTTIAVAPLAMAALIGAAMTLPRAVGPEWLYVSVIFALGLMALGVPVFCGWRAVTAWRARKRFESDLSGVVVLRFEGTIAAADDLDDEQSELLIAGMLASTPEAAQHLDVLPESSTVMCRHGRASVRFMPVTIAEVAAGPQYAMRVAVPSEMAWIDGAPDARFMRRSLNASEHAELAAHIQRLRRPGPVVLLWTGWLTIYAIGMAFDPTGMWERVQRRGPRMLLEVGVLVIVAMMYARSLRLAKRLERDIETGWAFTLHRRGPSASESPEAADSDRLGSEDPNPRECTEFLPHSRAVWNNRGRPAKWRNLRRAA